MRRCIPTALFLAFCTAPVCAIAAEPPTIVHQVRSQIVVESDGRFVQTHHFEQSATSKGAVEGIAREALGFNPTLEDLDILEAYTLKPDGTRKMVDAAAIRTQQAPGVPNVPMFADIQQKIIVFPDVNPGDLVVATYRRTVRKPLFPGNFTWDRAFSRAVSWNDTSYEITAPPGFALHAEGIGVQVEQSSDDKGTHIKITHSQPDAIAVEQYGVASTDRQPRVLVSSFANYEALAASYAALSVEKARVTPRVQSEADRITNGLVGHEAQAHALYNWTSAHIRYVALYLGRGGIEPHDADAILSNGYGDCKDHTVLLTALLAAKGIESRYALINLGNAYEIGGPPTLMSLNHVVNYLPEFHRVVDSTLATAAFGQLMVEEYGKTIVLTDTTPALSTVPTAVAADDTESVHTNATLAADGTITGHTIVSTTGTFAVSLRALGEIIDRTGAAKAAQNILAYQKQTGTGEFAVQKIDLTKPDYLISGSFKLEPQTGALEGDAFAPPIGLSLMARPGDILLGPLAHGALPDTEPTVCMAGHQEEELSLALPVGYTPTKLPGDRQIRNEAFTYSSHWQFADGVVSVHRELASRIATAQCTEALRKDAAAPLRDIRRDLQATISLQAS